MVATEPAVVAQAEIAQFVVRSSFGAFEQEALARTAVNIVWYIAAAAAVG